MRSLRAAACGYDGGANDDDDDDDDDDDAADVLIIQQADGSGGSRTVAISRAHKETANMMILQWCEEGGITQNATVTIMA